MKIYDCCTFFNENDLFEIRLNEHWDFVDKFIVVEAGETHTGIKKELAFDHERFAPYAEKLVYCSFDSFEEEMKKHPEYYDERDAWVHDYHRDWTRDSYQCCYVFKVLKDLGVEDTDLVLFSACDEIIPKDAMTKGIEVFTTNFTTNITDASGRITVNDCRPMVRFMQRYFVYKFNLQAHDQPIRPTASLTEFGNHRKIFPHLAREVGIITHIIEDPVGWHFSYADPTNGERYLRKIKSYAHASDYGKGLNGARRMDAQTPEDAVAIMKQEFNPVLIDLNPETHPKYLLDNLEKYTDYILKV